MHGLTLKYGLWQTGDQRVTACVAWCTWFGNTSTTEDGINVELSWICVHFWPRNAAKRDLCSQTCALCLSVRHTHIALFRAPDPSTQLIWLSRVGSGAPNTLISRFSSTKLAYKKCTWKMESSDVAEWLQLFQRLLWLHQTSCWYVGVPALLSLSLFLYQIMKLFCRHTQRIISCASCVPTVILMQQITVNTVLVEQHDPRLSTLTFLFTTATTF